MPPVINMKPFWRPASVGNGRMWMAGTVDLSSPDITLIQWRIDGSDWITGASGIAAGEDFGFYIMGDAPSEWGTVTIQQGWSQPTGTYYTYGVANEPHFVFMGPARLTRAASVGALAGGQWFWANETLYVRTIGDVLPGVVEARVDPIFVRGSTYHVEILATDIANATAVLADEQVLWEFDVDNNIDRFMQIMLPSAFSDSEFARSVFRMYARQMADLGVLYQDVAAQFNPLSATWGLGMWEEMLGLPTRRGVSFGDRRLLINGRRSLGSSKTEFYDSITEVSGPIEVTDYYNDYRIVLRLATADDAQLRNAVERMIDEKKPVGIIVDVSYSSFRAGISEAGDTL